MQTSNSRCFQVQWCNQMIRTLIPVFFSRLTTVKFMINGFFLFPQTCLGNLYCVTLCSLLSRSEIFDGNFQATKVRSPHN